jgi:hypothetical protein
MNLILTLVLNLFRVHQHLTATLTSIIVLGRVLDLLKTESFIINYLFFLIDFLRLYSKIYHNDGVTYSYCCDSCLKP